MATLQRTPITFQSRSPPSTEFTSRKTQPTLSFSTTFTFNPLKLTLKSPRRHRHRHGPRMADSAATSYATALADLAKSNGTLEATSSDVGKLVDLFNDTTVYDFFVSPIIDISLKRDLLDEIAKSSKLQPHTMNFLNILIDMKRIDLIKEIANEFEIVYNKYTDTEMAVVSSVVPLESQHLAQVAKQVQRLTGSKNVRIKSVIDPSLVAGFTIRYGSSGSKLIDMSIKKQLDEIAAQIDLGDIQLAV